MPWFVLPVTEFPSTTLSVAATLILTPTALALTVLPLTVFCDAWRSMPAPVCPLIVLPSPGALPPIVLPLLTSSSWMPVGPFDAMVLALMVVLVGDAALFVSVFRLMPAELLLAIWLPEIVFPNVPPSNKTPMLFGTPALAAALVPIALAVIVLLRTCWLPVRLRLASIQTP